MDVRLVWEVNRWTQIVRIAQAAWLSGDQDMARKAVAWLDDWLASNPVGMGLNWTSPMEPAIRLMNFCWIHALLSANGLTGDADRLAAAILPAHTAWVWRYRSSGSSANNHLIGELAGVAMAVSKWPGLAKVSAAPTEVARLLAKEVARQFFDDGGNREQALHYHLFAWEMSYQGLTALGTAGVKIAPDISRKLSDAAVFFASLAESAWDYGDSDDAHITPFYTDEATAITEWKAWLGGHPSDGFDYWLGKFRDCPPSPVPEGTWKKFPESGMLTVESEGIRLRADASPLGFMKMAAHGHLDALHLSIWKDGVAAIVDPGTGGYFASAMERSYLASQLAHNGPCPLDDHLYPKRRGSFLWERHHPIPVTENSSAGMCLRWKPDPRTNVEIKRVVGLEGTAVRIADTCNASPFQVFWQLAPGWKTHRSSPGKWIFHLNGLVLTINVRGASTADLVGEEGCQRTKLRGLVSPAFGKYQRAPGLLLDAPAGRPLETTFTFSKNL